MRRLILLTACAFAALASPALADESVWGAGVEVMDAADMEAHRGGFMVNGIDINFGAVITTYVNGVPALTTQLTWTDAGSVIEETVGHIGQSINSLTPDQLAALGIDSTGHPGGIVIDDSSGVTEIVHNVMDGALQNIIINSATGRDITQEIDVSLELPGFDMVQADLLVERFGFQITDDMRGVMFGAPGT